MKISLSIYSGNIAPGVLPTTVAKWLTIKNYRGKIQMP